MSKEVRGGKLWDFIPDWHDTAIRHLRGEEILRHATVQSLLRQGTLFNTKRDLRKMSRGIAEWRRVGDPRGFSPQQPQATFTACADASPYTWTEVNAFLSVFGAARNLRARYNVAPTTMVDVVRLDTEGRREIVPMRWGLVPFFWKQTIKEVPATFNARAETVHEKPMFRDAFKGRRCIIPASGFFEWTDEADGKQPHFFSAADGSPILGFAGLWDRWPNPATGEELLSCTMTVSGASEWMEPYHDRMPVLLAEKDFERWLSGAAGSEVLQPATASALSKWTVSKRVNKTGVGGR